MENPIPELFGRCKVEKRLGEGAVGTVYLAEHQALGIPVAVKVVPVRLLESRGQSSERFMREARMAARIRHPNVLRVYDCGEEAGYYYLVMDYIDGPTCKDRIEQDGRFPWQEGVDVGIGVADGLRCAAEAGVIHRDIKPDNIMVDSAGNPQVTDLGLAKSLGSAGGSITREEQLLGTPFYMSPEQIRDARYVDVRSDIYSLGASLYHMVCGDPPFAGSNIFEIMNKHLREPVPSPRSKVSEIPQALCDVIAKCMAKEAADRYQNYREVLEDLRHVAAGEEVGAAGAESHLQKGFVPEGETLAKLRGGRVFSPIEVPQPFLQLGAEMGAITALFGLVASVLVVFFWLWTSVHPVAAGSFVAVVAAAYGFYTVLLVRPRGQVVGPNSGEHTRARVYTLLEMISKETGMRVPLLCLVPRGGRLCTSYAAPTRGVKVQFSEQLLAQADPTQLELASLLTREVGRYYYGHTILLTFLDVPITVFGVLLAPVRALLKPRSSEESEVRHAANAAAAVATVLALALVLTTLFLFAPWLGLAAAVLLVVGLVSLAVRRWSDYSADVFAAAALANTEPLKSVIVKEGMADPQVRTVLLKRAQAYTEVDEGVSGPQYEANENEARAQVAYYFSRINWSAGLTFRLYEMFSDHPFAALRVNAMSGLGPRLPVPMRVVGAVLAGYERLFKVAESFRETFVPEPQRLRPYITLGLTSGLLIAVGTLVLFAVGAAHYFSFLGTVCVIAFSLGWVSAETFRRQGGTRRELCGSLVASVFSLAMCDMVLLGLAGAGSVQGTVLQIPTVIVVSLMMVSLGAAVALRVGRPVLPAYPMAAQGGEAKATPADEAEKKAAGLDLSDAGLTANLQLGDMGGAEPSLEPAEDGSEDGPKLEMVEEEGAEGEAKLESVEDEIEEAKLVLVEEPEQDAEQEPAGPEQEAEAAAPEAEPEGAAPPEAEQEPAGSESPEQEPRQSDAADESPGPDDETDEPA